MPLRKPALATLAVIAFGAFAGVAGTLFAQSSTHAILKRKEDRPEILHTDQTVTFDPMWSGSVLLGSYGNQSPEPVIWTIDRAGRKSEIPLSIPGSSQLYVWSLAGLKDGSIVVGGFALGKDSQGSGFLGIISPDRSQKTIVRTAPFVPRAVTVDPTGTIWAVGWDVEDEHRTYNVLRRFDASGKLLSASALHVKVDAVGDASHGSTLRSSADRVAWLSGAGEFIEFSLDGRETNRLPGPPWTPTTSVMTTMAINDRDEVLAYTMARGDKDHPMWILNRVKRRWDQIDVAEEKLPSDAKMFGFDGDDLVMGATSAQRGHLIVRYSLTLEGPDAPTPQ